MIHQTLSYRGNNDCSEHLVSKFHGLKILETWGNPVPERELSHVSLISSF